MEQARVIIDPPSEGAWNMAVDAALLETANETGLISLRFYSWSEPTLSLGYFQTHEHRGHHDPSRDCPLIRRSTGGGAILHDDELTYSLCLPSANRWSKSNEKVYFMMHELIVDLLAERDIKAVLFGDENDCYQHEFDPQAFLCFERRTTGDVTIKGQKVGGSAQRRKKSALLQHGSLLMKSSNAAPKLNGIEDLSDCTPINLEELTSDWIVKLQGKLGIEFLTDTLSQKEAEAATRAKTDLYAHDGWTLRR